MSGSTKSHISNRFRRLVHVVPVLLAGTLVAAPVAHAETVSRQSGLLELYWTGGVFMHPILARIRAGS